MTVNEIPNRPESSQIDLNIAYNVQLNSKDNTQKLSSPPPGKINGKRNIRNVKTFNMAYLILISIIKKTLKINDDFCYN